MILVLNCGSSSVKYRGYPDGKDGLVERIGEPGGDAPDHATALRSVLSTVDHDGLEALEGLVMGTRTGDLDPGVVFHLYRVGGFSLDEVDDLLNHQGGLAGLCGDNDMRAVLSRRASGDAAVPAATGERVISPDGAEVAVCVVPTDEEREIATQTGRVVTR